jgi:hypothetical protein
MGPTQALLSSVASIFFFVMTIAAVWKVFQATNDLADMKKLLQDIRNNTDASNLRVIAPPAATAAAPVATPVEPVQVPAVAPVPAPVQQAATTPVAGPPVVPPVIPQAAAPVQAAPPSILAGPISLESAEALLREIEAESRALDAAEKLKSPVAQA